MGSEMCIRDSPICDPPRLRHAREGRSPLSGTLTHLRTEARTDYRTHSRRARKGSNTHDTGHRKHSPCPRHPAPRGNVQGLVDHEDKVKAAFSASAKK
mgnify:CR=1 FL=1